MTLQNDARASICPIAVETVARTRLSTTGHRSLGSVRCRYRDGTLTLQGKVPSYYHKQLAQEAIRKVSNVELIVNEINVWS